MSNLNEKHVNNEKHVKIPLSIVEYLVELLDDQNDPDIANLHLYLHGKVIQAKARESYNPNDKEAIALYAQNKKIMDQLEIKIKNIFITNPM